MEAAVVLTARDWQTRIVTELRGGEALQGIIEGLWEERPEYAATPRLRYLYTKLAAIAFLIGTLDEELATPVEGDLPARSSQRLRALQFLYQQTAATITKRTRARKAVVGKLETTSIIPAPLSLPSEPADWNDASDPVYAGNPYSRPLPVQSP